VTGSFVPNSALSCRANDVDSIDQTQPLSTTAMDLTDTSSLPAHWDWCRFRIVDAGGGEIALLSSHGTFVRAAHTVVDQSSPAPGDTHLPQGWQQERFTAHILVDRSHSSTGRKVSIQSSGAYICAQAGGAMITSRS
jgi:hypothetical protein